MKFSTCLAAFSITLAVATCGCRYDNAAGDGAGQDGVDTEAGRDINADLAESEYDNKGEGTLDELAGAGAAGKTFRDLGYAVCTDVAFEPVYFGFDATTIAPAELAKVEEVARHLASNPDRVVSIEGNCDERGSNEYNLSLGDDRAIVIANFLAQNGIARERMETVSRGETNPAVVGSDESAWAKNRRGEFVILKK